jgi:hypothetical protein
MKFALFILFILHFMGNAQSKDNYERLTAKAGLFHLQGNSKDAVHCYEKAFKLRAPNSLEAYKAAGVYALENNAGKAFKYLILSIESGWTETDWLMFDPYFDKLKVNNPRKWKKTVQTALRKEEQYASSLEMPKLRKDINLMALEDQRLRYKRSNSNGILKNIEQEIEKADYNNLVKIKEIIKLYHWPKISQIGKDGQNNLWLIVQHADQDVLFQKDVLDKMEKLYGTHEINIENYAFLLDRVRCNLNYKQIYGTQVVWKDKGTAENFRPIENEDAVDARRKKIGLNSLEIYSLSYGFDYKKLTKTEIENRDLNEKIKVKSLTDSAKQAFFKNDYLKTYDLYNTASTFLDGMSNDDNLEAAVIFSKIAAADQNTMYKSIALDFLNLLYLRKYITKPQLLKNSDFQILYNEKRWTDIIEEL